MQQRVLASEVTVLSAIITGAWCGCERTKHRQHDTVTLTGTVRGGRSTLDTACLLLEHGTNVDAEEKWGKTLLQMAMNSGQDEMAELLSEFRSERAEQM